MLSDKQILKSLKSGQIQIEPFDRECLGSNSYDVHLGSTLLTYKDAVLDAKKDNETVNHQIGSDGFVLQPNTLYLGCITEWVKCIKRVPIIEGKSSIARLGISPHHAAGVGDEGWAGYFTLEITVVQPVRIYAGMPIGQIIFFKCGKTLTSYNEKLDAKYHNQPNIPIASKMFENF